MDGIRQHGRRADRQPGRHRLGRTLTVAVSTGAAPAHRFVPVLGAVALIAALVFAFVRLGAQPQGTALSLSLVFGSLFGVVLQRSRFCFLCVWRDLLDNGDPRGVLGILAALIVGMVGYTVIYGAFLPDPGGSRLPPQAHIGPVGPVLVLGGLLFGAGMAISGSCISAHLYRLGEGSPTAPFALLGTAAGFGLSFVAWNPLYLASISDSPVLWLPRMLGYSGALAAGLVMLALITWPLVARLPQSTIAAPRPMPLKAIFIDRWPTWIGGLAVGALAVMAYLRIGPLGVTAEIGSRTRQAASVFDLLPARLEGLDSFRGCATVIRDVLLTQNGMFIAGLVLASFAAALIAGQFKPTRPTGGQIGRGLIGGILLGFGAMIGLGCSVGTLLSGVMAGALSGWVFGAAMFAGVTGTFWAGRRMGWLG